ncbi:gfo/Idh/MocA family oxidoreductase [Phyllobacterium salinisoli]|uniref:Gfo/Idh/MocA family oxidoreductase n=1 Tax=Phyllobacterium salinisoli TaxID=1899321 RepID=A0A368K932_9HYPH|nr:Gfo/Idh/MocA family oxidoreductase [Phyllobacterium salinisoli]RCS25115.1 gfo/Idh/MocA family oxidoreductase [Phyllobacterium salinisoli]
MTILAQAAPQPRTSSAPGLKRPRLGFLGVGWIGRQRMEAVMESGYAEAAGIADPSPEMAAAAREIAPRAEAAASLDELLEMDLDGVVIATPSALHAAQSITALKRGVAVFCQKPLGRTATEVEEVVRTAREADRLLGVDLSYRFTAAMQCVRDSIQSGEIGAVHAAELVFHNAYGPDKPWFYDPDLSGGGCVMDLGIHLVDLALWTLDFPAVSQVSGSLFSEGERLYGNPDRVEDHAVATLEFETGAVVRIACSWRLHAGCDADISATFYGRNGALAFSNVSGSFYDFKAERFTGTSRQTLINPPDAWGGMAAVDWARRLAAGSRFSPVAEQYVDVATVLDRIYAR